MKHKITLKLHSPVCIKKNSREQECRYVPPNPNKRMHWVVKNRWNREWKSEVQIAVMQKRKDFPHLPLPGKVTITFLYKSINLMDEDNAVASAKPLIDALTVKGGGQVLEDDTTRHVSVRVKQTKVNTRAEQGVEITLAWTQT